MSPAAFLLPVTGTSSIPGLNPPAAQYEAVSASHSEPDSVSCFWVCLFNRLFHAPQPNFPSLVLSGELQCSANIVVYLTGQMSFTS